MQPQTDDSNTPPAPPDPAQEDRSGRSQHDGSWRRYVLVVACVVIMATGITFAVGVANFNQAFNENNTTVPTEDYSLLGDSTFFILFSQLLPIVLISFFEVMKVRYAPEPAPDKWKENAVSLCAHGVAACLSIAAAGVYGKGGPTNVWMQIVAMSLSASASLSVIIAGMVSVFDAGHARDRNARDAEFQEEIDRLKAEITRMLGEREMRETGDRAARDRRVMLELQNQVKNLEEEISRMKRLGGLGAVFKWPKSKNRSTLGAPCPSIDEV